MTAFTLGVKLYIALYCCIRLLSGTLPVLSVDASGRKSTCSLVGYNHRIVESSYTAVDVSGDENVGCLIGRGNKQGVVNSSFVFSNLDGYDNSVDCDLLVLRDHDKISYSVETRMLYLVVGGDKYSSSDVSPLEAHKLAQSLGEGIVEMSEHFRASLVAM